MKKLIAFCLVCLLFGCSDDKPVLYVYNWADYISPDLVQKFEAENNCKVSIDQFDDNEAMLAKLLAGADGYDLIFPSSYTVNVFKKHNLIKEIDLTKLTNVVENFDSKYANLIHDKDMKHSVPYAFSMTGICYRKDKIGNYIVNSNSWNMLFDDFCKNRVCILNDLREMLGISLKYNGNSVNSIDDKELTNALETALKFKSVASKLDNLQYKSGIACDEFYICIGYNSDVLQIKDECKDIPIEFFIPKEGSTCCFDEICITKTSKNTELAYRFIDFLYDAENAAINAKYICTAVPNKNMWKYIFNEDKHNELFNIPIETLDKLEPIEDVGENLIKYNKIWDEFKSTRK